MRVGYLASMPPAPNEQQADVVARQALWFAGAISYRRAFTSGRGHLVSKGSRIRINDQWKEVLNRTNCAHTSRFCWGQTGTLRTKSPNTKVSSPHFSTLHHFRERLWVPD